MRIWLLKAQNIVGKDMWSRVEEEIVEATMYVLHRCENIEE